MLHIIINPSSSSGNGLKQWEKLEQLFLEAGAEYALTASIGYSSYCGDIHDFQNALAKADEALYEEKKNRK